MKSVLIKPSLLTIKGGFLFILVLSFTFLTGCNSSEVKISDSTSLSKAPPIGGIYFGNGVRTGEVHQKEAIFWARTTLAPEMTKHSTEFIKNKSKKEVVAASVKDPFGGQIPKGKNLDDINGSMMGMSGEVRFSYFPKGSKEKTITTTWFKTQGQKNFITQYRAKNLNPGTDYILLSECRKVGADQISDRIVGSFKTAPSRSYEAEPTFVAVTCGDYPRRDDEEKGHVIYNTMLKMDPDFFVHTGDIEYYDKPNPYAISTTLAQYKWDRLYSLPYLRTFHNHVTSYFMKDDHDTTMNDSFPGKNFGALTWDDGIRIFKEQFPMGEKTYRNVRWGKHLEVWMVEGRDYRSVNRDPDGPQKTIWGEEQKSWFFKTFKNSDATFRILISPTPVVGPDRKNKKDNHANDGFKHEGDEIRKFLSEQKNAFIICGDRHWQYHSTEPSLGVHEFSCGPSSNNHASGYRETLRNDYHQYLKVLGGFLSVSIKGSNNPKITFKHHAPKGEVRYEKSFTSR